MATTPFYYAFSAIFDIVAVLNTIEGSKGEYTVIFDGSEWEGKPLVLSSSRQPYEARVFKSIDGAAAELLRIGLSEASIKNTTKSNNK